MSILAQVSQAMQTVLNEYAEKAAEETGLIQRRRKVTGSKFCQTLVFGWLQNPDATLEDLCQMGSVVGLEITPQGLEQRFSETASTFLYEVLQNSVKQLIQTEEVAIPLLQRFNGVYIEDSSIITLPKELTSIWLGAGGNGNRSNSAVKLQVRWDMLRGKLDGPHLTNGRTHDRVATQLSHPLPQKSLLIRDLGYWKLAYLEQLDNEGCYWISRVQAQTQFVDQLGQVWRQIDYVRQQTSDSFDVTVELGKQKRMKARLVGFRVPDEVAQERRRKLNATSKQKGQTPSDDRLALCDWTLFVTNVPLELLSVTDVLVLARLRWQIELLFKLWKSHGQIDCSRSEKPWRQLCELYAKLLGMIIQHWSFLIGNWRFPDRSLVKAAATVRQHALHLAFSMPDLSRLMDAFSLLRTCLSNGLRINKSAKSPRTFQLLLTCTEEISLN